MTHRPAIDRSRLATSRSEPNGRARARVAPALALATLALLLAPPAHAAKWNWSGSGTLDYLHLLDVPKDAELAKVGQTVEWSLKATVDVSEKTTVTARLCTSCHGFMIDQAYAEIRFMPQANLEAGRIHVPFGDFYQRFDPASDAFLSKPLPYEMGHMIRYQVDRFNLGVLPMPYVDQGAALFGDVWFRDKLQLWYSLYGVSGFRGDQPRDFVFKSQLSDVGYSDNNADISWGGRVALAQGPLALGGSYLSGSYDPDVLYGYSVWGVDGSVHALGLHVRGEYLERGTDVVDEGVAAVLRKKGFYVQLEAPVGSRLALVGRLDGLLRQGPPLGTDNDESSGIVRFTVGANVTPAVDYGFRVQFEHWRFTDFDDVNAFHVGTVVTY